MASIELSLTGDLDSGSNDAINTGTKSNAPATGDFEEKNKFGFAGPFLKRK